MINRRQVLRFLASVGLISVATGGYALGVEPMGAPAITRYRVTPPRWPGGLHLTIAVIADLHACRPWMSPERIRSIVQTTNALNADVIVLLGDYVAGHRYITGPVNADEWARELAALRAPLGVHAILGNHDWWDDQDAQARGAGPTVAQQALQAAGLSVLENDAVRLDKAGQPFWIAGLGDQLAFLLSRLGQRGRPRGIDDLSATMAKVTDDAPVILLAHEPDVATRVTERVSLLLCGHTHGGQVRLFGWSPVVPSRYGGRFAYGHVKERCDVIISGGLGCSIAPVRLGVPPEIVLVTLAT